MKQKTIEEINQKIKEGRVVVLRADEFVEFAKNTDKGSLFEKVDVVTTATFGPMCSSGAYLNLGHPKPRIKIGGGRCYLNDVPAYTGFAAVDIYIGATALPDDDPRNKVYPGEFAYGGGHVIEDLVARKPVKLQAFAYGTDCYPRKELKTYITLDDINEAILLNPRNCYQNYNVAVNTSDKVIYTYMGMLLPNLKIATFCSAGVLSPLLKDPLYKTIGIGTRIFLGGGIGYVYFWGTQHNPDVERTDKNIPKYPAGTLALCGDLKKMSPQFLKGVSFRGYGVSLAVGVGIPIPVLDEEILDSLVVGDDGIFAPVVDYSRVYPQGLGEILGFVSYAELYSGQIEINKKKIKTAPLSSRYKAIQIAEILKNWIKEGRFFLTEKLESLPLPSSGYKFKPLEIKWE